MVPGPTAVWNLSERVYLQSGARIPFRTAVSHRAFAGDVMQVQQDTGLEQLEAGRERQETEGSDLALQLLKMAHVVLQHKLLIIMMCGATAIFSAAYSLTLPNVYSATAKVLPPKGESSGLSSLLGQMGGLAGLAPGAASGSDTDVYVGILNSRSVADAVIRRLELAKVYSDAKTPDEVRRKLDQAVKVQAGKDGIIVISAEDLDARRASQLANCFIEELGRTTVRLNLSKAGAEKYFLEQRLVVTRNDLKKAENDLKKFSEHNKMVHPDLQTGASVAGISALKANLASAEVQLAVLRDSQTDESPEVKALLAGIRRIRQDLARLAGASGGGEGIPNLGEAPRVELEYLRKTREVQIQAAILEQLSRQYEVAKLNLSRDSSTLQVLDEAVAPDEKSRPKRGVIVILATLAALVVSLLLAFALEYLKTMPQDQREMVQNLRRLALNFSRNA